MTRWGRGDGRVEAVAVTYGLVLLIAAARVWDSEWFDLAAIFGVGVGLIYAATAGRPRPVPTEDGAAEIPPLYRATANVAVSLAAVLGSRLTHAWWDTALLVGGALPVVFHLGWLIARRPRVELRPGSVRILRRWGGYDVPWEVITPDSHRRKRVVIRHPEHVISHGLARRSPSSIALPDTTLTADDLGLLIRFYVDKPQRRAGLATREGYENLAAIVDQIDRLRTQYRYVDRGREVAGQP